MSYQSPNEPVESPREENSTPNASQPDLSYSPDDAIAGATPFTTYLNKADAHGTIAEMVEPMDRSSDRSSMEIQDAQKSHGCLVALWARIVHLVQTVMPYGGFVSSCFTLCTVTLGGGIIGMPSAFHTSGVIMGVIYLVVVTGLTIYSMVILGYAMDLTGLDSFENMARGLFGRGGDYFVGFVMWLSCFGTAIAYIIGVNSCMSPILKHSSSPEYLKTESGNRLITSLIWLALMSPLIIPKHVNSVRYFSAFSVVFVVFFVFAVVIHSCTHGLTHFADHKNEIRLFNTDGPQSIDAFSIFIFAFLCHGVCFPVRFEMRPKPSIKKLTWSTTVAMIVCMVFYLLAGIFGYLDFGANVEDSILYNYDPVKEPIMMVAYICILMKLVTAYVMNFVPIRNFIYYCLKWDLDTLPYWRHGIVMTLVSTVILVIGLFVPTIDLVFALVGSACGSFIAFIFPALFWMYCGNWSLKSVGLFHYIMTYILIIVGVMAFSFGTLASVYYSFIHEGD